jgi:hypothetical protein
LLLCVHRSETPIRGTALSLTLLLCHSYLFIEHYLLQAETKNNMPADFSPTEFLCTDTLFISSTLLVRQYSLPNNSTVYHLVTKNLRFQSRPDKIANVDRHGLV